MTLYRMLSLTILSRKMNRIIICPQSDFIFIENLIAISHVMFQFLSSFAMNNV